MIKRLRLHNKALRFASHNLLLRQPWSSMVNILSLTVTIWLLLAIITVVNTNLLWQKNAAYPKVVVFLKAESGQTALDDLQDHLRHQVYLRDYSFIDKSKLLKELGVQQLPDVQLPPVLVASTTTASSQILRSISSQLEALPYVAQVNVDYSYANKLSQLIVLIDNLSFILQVIFALILIITIYNAVGLQLNAEAEEIGISRLVGAEDSFIMRPYNYYALLQVVAAFVLALLIYYFSFDYLNLLLQKLSSLFSPDFKLLGPTFWDLLKLFLVLVLLTVFSVFIAVKVALKNNHS